MKDIKGFTLIEMSVILAIIGILAAIVAPTVSFGVKPLRDTTNRVAGDFKLIRAKAMSQTSAYRLMPDSATRLRVERARSCDPAETWTVDPSFTDEDLQLTKDIQLVDTLNPDGTLATPATNWSLCFDNRGLADNNLMITLRDIQANEQNRVEVFSGGTVQIYDN